MTLLTVDDFTDDKYYLFLKHIVYMKLKFKVKILYGTVNAYVMSWIASYWLDFEIKYKAQEL